MLHSRQKRINSSHQLYYFGILPYLSFNLLCHPFTAKVRPPTTLRIDSIAYIRLKGKNGHVSTPYLDCLLFGCPTVMPADS